MLYKAILFIRARFFCLFCYFMIKKRTMFLQPNVSSDDDVTALVSAAAAGASKILDLLIEVLLFCPL